MKAEILAVGTEILLGDIVNTNAQYLARRLADLGIFVYHQSVVGDNEDRLLEAYELAFKRADLVITSGGLGPTKDDLTKEVGAKYFNKEFYVHDESLSKLKELFSKRNQVVSEANRKGSIAPINNPTSTGGFRIDKLKTSPKLFFTAIISTSLLKAAINARAVKAADPIAKPFPVAAVVLPSESSASVRSLTSAGKWAISAIPPALSATGPYASVASVIPSVLNIPTAEIPTP